jgi:hypothetical protein
MPVASTNAPKMAPFYRAANTSPECIVKLLDELRIKRA